ncbi:unnamed protein product, partial [Ilex paraguariensis]
SESENFKFEAQDDGLKKGKALPKVPKAPLCLRKRENSEDSLNPQEQTAPKMLKVLTLVSRSVDVRSANPLSIQGSVKLSSSNESDHALLSSCMSNDAFKKQDKAQIVEGFQP